MMKIVSLLMKRPSNTQIRVSKALFWVGIISIGIIAFYIHNLTLNDSVLGISIWESEKMIIQYSIILLWLPILILGSLDISFLSRGRTRILQIIFWIILFIVWGMFQNTPTLTIDVLYPLLGIMAIISGISGKMITTKWLKYWQKITKIRV